MKSFSIRSGHIIFIGALSGALSVFFGAMGAHALKDVLVGEYQSYFEKAVFYQFVHSFLILFIGIIYDSTKGLRIAAILSVIGIIFFSGSLYLFSLQQVIDLGAFKKFLGPITPVGGLCFIGAWLIIAIKGLKSQKDNK